MREIFDRSSAKKTKKLRHTGRGGNDGPVIGSWGLESSVIDSLEWVEPNS